MNKLSVAIVAWIALATCMSVQAADVDVKGYHTDVAPFLQQHCVQCHGPKKQAGKLSLHDLPAKFDGEVGKTWRHVAERINLGEMPPETRPRPDAKGAREVVEWITKELRKTGKQGADAIAVRSGNHVDHDALFDGKADVPFASPPRIWRLRPEIYDQLVGELAKGQSGIAQPFVTGADDVFKDVADGLAVDEPTTSQLLRNAAAVVAKQTRYEFKDGKIKNKFGAKKEFVVLLDPKTPPTKEQIEKAIESQFRNVLKRAPTEDERNRFVALMDKNIADAGREQGVRTTLMAVLLLPEAVFRMELGTGPADEQGRRMLSPRELAFAISYALTDRRPDSTLLKAAESGKLATKEDVAREVERIWNDPKSNPTRILGFFREYFGYAAAVDVFKDSKDNKHHEPRILVGDTDRLIEYILERDKDVLVELLTTNKSFVNVKWDRKKKRLDKAHAKKLAETSYNVEKWASNQPMTLPSGQRAGILTQPSWLVAHSLNADNHAILRGKWVRERLLGGTVPDLPITVDAQLPEDPDKTLRQRMEVTKQEYCWQCHQRMNNLGLPFEMYDHFGRFRSEELAKPVDATGLVERSGDAKLEGEVPNAIAMLNKLAKSERVRQVFVRHVFRYWMGREETLADSKTLIEADRAYVESGGSFKALILSLMTSDTFLYRTPQRTASK